MQAASQGTRFFNRSGNPITHKPISTQNYLAVKRRIVLTGFWMRVKRLALINRTEIIALPFGLTFPSMGSVDQQGQRAAQWFYPLSYAPAFSKTRNNHQQKVQPD